jgi:hypothetical protein
MRSVWAGARPDGLKLPPNQRLNERPMPRGPHVPCFRADIAQVTIASLIVGAVLAHFGITTDRIMLQVGLSQVLELARQGLTWPFPTCCSASLVIVPLWFLFYLFRPPRARSD